MQNKRNESAGNQVYKQRADHVRRSNGVAKETTPGKEDKWENTNPPTSRDNFDRSRLFLRTI